MKTKQLVGGRLPVQEQLCQVQLQKVYLFWIFILFIYIHLLSIYYGESELGNAPPEVPCWYTYIFFNRPT